MLNRLVIKLIQVITNTFFRRIDVAGMENVPEEGPVIFAGNHPNALMDGWLLTAKCGRWPLHFLANAKLWKYRMLAPLLNASGAVPVYRREEHEGAVDNQGAFDKLYEVLESGDCMGIFPEGVSHAESQLATLKTGTARIALAATARGKVAVKIVPCGLNYIHRHRFRSQVLLEFGEPIVIDDDWLDRYRQDEQETVRHLTDRLADALRGVTLNAPDWRSLRIIQTARRLYKPKTAELSPAEYVELNRRFVAQYVEDMETPEVRELSDELEDYQARLDMFGLKDYQLRQPVTLSKTFRRIMVRGLTLLVLLPISIPGALLHLPVGWVAAIVGERFSYEMDDIATLKVFASILLLPLLYLAVAIFIGISFGLVWAVVILIVLSISFLASVRLLEAEAGLFMSILSMLRVARFGREVDDLRAARAKLVTKIRDRVERYADPNLERIFTVDDFSIPSSDRDAGST